MILGFQTVSEAAQMLGFCGERWKRPLGLKCEKQLTKVGVVVQELMAAVDYADRAGVRHRARVLGGDTGTEEGSGGDEDRSDLNHFGG